MKTLIPITLVILLIFTSCGGVPKFNPTHPQNTSADASEKSNVIIEGSTDASAADNRLGVAENGICIGDRFISDTEKEEIKTRNFPTVDEVSEKYPGKTVITWILSTVTYLDAYLPFRTTEVNEYLDSLGCDFAVCFVPCTSSGDKYPDMLEKLIAGGVQVDILSPSYSFVTDPEENNYQRDVMLSILEPLDGYFETTERGRAFYNSMPQEYFDAFRVGGSIYGISGTASNLFGEVGYSVDNELLEKYGWDTSKTIEEQIYVLEQVALLEKNTCTVFCGNYGDISYHPENFDRFLGVFFNEESGVIRKITENVKYRKGLELLYTLKEKGLLTYNAPIESDTCFLFMERVRYCGESGNLQSRTIGNITSERTTLPYSSPTIINNVSAIGISSRSVNKDKAFELLILALTDPDLNNLLVFGVEGEDYTLEGQRAKGGENVSMNFSRFGNLAVCLPFGIYSDTINQDCKVVYKTAKMASYLGFAFDVEPVSAEYSAIKAVMKGFDFLKADTAENSLAELDKLLDEAGIGKVTDEMNRQYAEWKKNR